MRSGLFQYGNLASNFAFDNLEFNIFCGCFYGPFVVVEAAMNFYAQAA